MRRPFKTLPTAHRVDEPPRPGYERWSCPRCDSPQCVLFEDDVHQCRACGTIFKINRAGDKEASKQRFSLKNAVFRVFGSKKPRL